MSMTKGRKEDGSAPESRPEVAGPPKVMLRRPGDPGVPRCLRSRGGPPPPPQTDGPPPFRSALNAPCALDLAHGPRRPHAPGVTCYGALLGGNWPTHPSIA